MAAFYNRASEEFHRKENEGVKQELIAAGIPYLQLPTHLSSEVKTDYVGILNGFLFTRAWRYWACTGDMPLEHAMAIYEMYADLAVRAEGDAANRQPVGRNVAYEKKLKEVYANLKNAGLSNTEIYAALEHVQDDPSEPRFVTTYHIDTEEGLAALAGYIRSQNLYAHNGKPASLAEDLFNKLGKEST